jgi:class I fructose-bisphosphate aldolase
MNRLFGNGRCLDVAIDHGVCNEPSFLDGLEDMPAVVKAAGRCSGPMRSR